MVTKTAGRVLDALATLHIAERTKKTDATNSPDQWSQPNGSASIGPSHERK
jgi:hypothetical protein